MTVSRGFRMNGKSRVGWGLDVKDNIPGGIVNVREKICDYVGGGTHGIHIVI